MDYALLVAAVVVWLIGCIRYCSGREKGPLMLLLSSYLSWWALASSALTASRFDGYIIGVNGVDSLLSFVLFLLFYIGSLLVVSLVWARFVARSSRH